VVRFNKAHKTVRTKRVLQSVPGKFAINEQNILEYRYNDLHRTVIPDSLQSRILFLFHDTPLAGHLGRDKTLSQLQQHVFWPDMKTSVANYINNCDACRIQKASKSSKNGLLKHFEAATTPFERVHTDVFKLPVTSRGNCCILSTVCAASKWCELEPMKGETAKETAEAFVNSVVTRHGPPKIIVTDRGANFRSEFFAELTRILRVKHKFSTPQSPQTSGTVERIHRSLRSIISILVREYGKEWDELIHMVAYALRTHIHSSTGVSPFMYLYARHPLSLFDLARSYPGAPSAPKLQAHNLIARQNEIWATAQKQVAVTNARKEKY